MTAKAIYLENVLTPHKRRVVECELSQIFSLAPHWDRPHIALLNGLPVMRADWDQYLKSGDVLAFIDVNAIPQGGGGGSNPLQLVAMLAVMYVAYQTGIYFGPAAAGGTGALTAAQASMATSAMMMGGMMLVNALIRPATLPTPGSLAAASPTYNVQAQGNAGRLQQAIPEQFGRMLFFPDFAAQPYTEYAGNDQYLYQLMVLGRGYYSVENVFIGTTNITSFGGIEYELVSPGGSVTLFPANVTTSTDVSGQAPVNVSQCNTVSTPVTVENITYTTSATIPSGTTGDYAVVSTPDPNNFVVTVAGNPVTVQYTAHGLSLTSVVNLTFTTTTTSVWSGGLLGSHTYTTNYLCTVSPWVGPFVSNLPDTNANFIALDYVFARGLYSANDDGSLGSYSVTVTAQAQPIDTYGNPTGPFVLLGTPTYTAATTTPQRYSERYAVTSGRYQIRVRRETLQAVPANTRIADDMAWASLRGYMPDTTDYGDVTLMAMRMLASNNLSAQGSTSINVIATRMLPIWNGSTWSTYTATRSIAWAFAYACKQVGLNDAQIDLATLMGLDGVWSGRGDCFDGRYDSFSTFWDAVTKMAQAGRAKPYMQGGVMRMMRDQAATLPVALFSVRNIAKGSFKITYLMPTPSTADSVETTYWDEGDWTARTVMSTLPGSTALLPAQVQLFGVGIRQQAYNEGMYQAACNRYRRKAITFDTEMEGFIPSFGDLIAIQHDMPSWGQGGEVIAWNALTNTATLSEPPIFEAGTNYITFRKNDGSVDGPYIVTAGGVNQVVLSSAPAYTPIFGTDQEKTHYAFGNGNAYLLAKVVAVRPGGLYKVSIDAINDDPNVYTAGDGLTAPIGLSSDLTVPATIPIMTGLTSSQMPNQVGVILLSWQPSSGASHYVIEESGDGQTWTRVGDVTACNFTCSALYSYDTIVRVAAVGIVQGPWVLVYFGEAAAAANALDLLPAPVASVSGEMFSVLCSWTFGGTSRTDIMNTEIWWSATDDRSTAVMLTSVPYSGMVYTHPGVSPGQSNYYWFRLNDTHGTPSAWYPSSATGGLYATPSTDPSALLTQLENSVGLSQLTTSLSTPINLVTNTITPIAPTLVSAAAIFPAIQNVTATTPAALTCQAVASLQDALSGYDLTSRMQWQEAVTNATITTDPISGKIQLLATANVTTDVQAQLNTVQVTANAAKAEADTTAATVTTLNGNLTTALGQITVMSGQLASSASTVYVDSSVANATGAITTTAANAYTQLAQSEIQGALDAFTTGGTLTALTANVATVQNNITTNANAISSVVTSQAALVAIVAANGAAITNEQTARASADSAAADNLTNLTSTVNTNNTNITASLSTESSTRATADTALSTSITTLSAQVNDPTTGLPNAYATISSNASTAASATSAVSTSLNTLHAQVNDPTTGLPVVAAVASSASTSASTAASGVATLNATTTLKAQANGAFAAFELSASTGGTGGSVLFECDNFQICKPSGSSSTAAPIPIVTLGTIGGVPALGLAGNLLIDGSVVAATVSLGTTGHIAAGQTAYNSGSGFFLGYNTASSKYVLSLGNSASGNITWDGANLNISGNVSASSVTGSHGMIAYATDGVTELVNTEGTGFWAGYALFPSGTAYPGTGDYRVRPGVCYPQAAPGSMTTFDLSTTSWSPQGLSPTTPTIISGQVWAGKVKCFAAAAYSGGTTSNVSQYEIAWQLNGTGTLTQTNSVAINGCGTFSVVFSGGVVKLQFTNALGPSGQTITTTVKWFFEFTDIL